MEQFLLQRIEAIRLQMIEEAIVQNSLTNEEVVALSQKLDRYIVFYQKRKKKALQASEQHERLAAAY